MGHPGVDVAIGHFPRSDLARKSRKDFENLVSEGSLKRLQTLDTSVVLNKVIF
jgi:hypothetical protein